MSETLKFIVKGVNELLGKNYNLIGFNALSSEDLLQILSDVLMKIQDQDTQRIDIRTETPEQSYIRIFSVLHILKYQPQTDLATFRQGLARGDSEIVHPILAWLLSHKDISRQRAYLSRFLIKVEIPPDCLDADISALNDQYMSLVDQFKVLHKEREIGKKTGETAAELTADLQAMGKEKEVATTRIEKMKVKASSGLHLLDAARFLRLEKDKERDYALQREQEKEAISTLQTSLQRLTRELQILRRDDAKLTPLTLIQNLTKEVAVQTAFAKERLPQEINTKKNRNKALSLVKRSTYLGPEEIANLRSRLDVIARDVQVLVESKVQDNGSDKMELFRQQAAAVANMKHNVLERLEKTDNLLKELQDRLKEEKEQSKYLIEDIAPKGEEFKRYVARLKAKSTLYKSCRNELAGLKAENGVLSRTVVILEGQIAQLSHAGNTAGITVASLPQNCTIENAVAINSQFAQTISTLRPKLASLLKDVQSLRTQVTDVEDRYDAASRSHDVIEANMEDSMGNLSVEINELKEKFAKDNEERERLKKIITKMESLEEKITKYINNGGTKDGRAIKKEFNDSITAEEKKLKVLKEEEERVKEIIERNQREVQQWQHIISIFKCKFQCAEENKQNDGIVVRMEGVETLVLQ